MGLFLRLKAIAAAAVFAANMPYAAMHPNKIIIHEVVRVDGLTRNLITLGIATENL